MWDARRERLFWIDSLKKKIWSANADGTQVQGWDVPTTIGSIGLCEDNRLIAGLDGGFGLISLNGNQATVEWLGDPDVAQADTRLNDGKVDGCGRFWCGTMNTEFAADNAALFRLDPDLSWERMDDGFTVSNGIAFSPDGKTLYFSDSRVDRSFRYDLEPSTGRLSNRCSFIDTTTYAGRIDGATVDANGRYWAALFEGSSVACFSPEGKLLLKIALPVQFPTMCCFGGKDLTTLYITSATFLMSQEQQRQEPLAGALLAVEGTGARGREENRFRMK